MDKRKYGVMRALITLAAFSLGAWDFRQGVRGGLDSRGAPQYAPKRTKFKGWQRQARESKR